MLSQFFTFEVLMVLGILGILTACPTYFIYAIARTKPSARPIPYFPHGVHGWLLVFVATVILSIILTAIDAINAVNVMNQAGALNWAVLSPSIVIIGLYIYCLWLIARKREAYVVKQTIVILWVVGADLVDVLEPAFRCFRLITPRWFAHAFMQHFGRFTFYFQNAWPVPTEQSRRLLCTWPLKWLMLKKHKKRKKRLKKAKKVKK